MKISRSFGVIKVDLNPNTNITLAEISGLGYLTSPLGTTVGFTKSNFAALGENCRLILWVKDDNQVLKLKNILGNLENLCVVSPIAGGK